jgi:flagellar motility protein MotE (MotC chaperone)
MRLRRIPPPRLLPATIVAIAALMTLKVADFTRAALAEEPAAKAAPAEPPAKAAEAADKTGAQERKAAGTAAPDVSGKPADDTAAADKGGAAAQAANAEPPVSESERALLLDLRHRRQALEARERALDEREALLAAAQTKLTGRIEELGKLQAKLESLEAGREAHDQANWSGLVRIYEAMKPRDAAAIFDSLDMQVLLGVMDRMSERKAAPILAAMQPDRARLVTQMLAEMRVRATTPTGEKPATILSPKG